jgi:competence protein ComEC
LETINGLEFPPVYLAGGLGASMLPLLKIDQALQRQRGHLLPWIPVCLGLGIGCFFALTQDPDFTTYAFIGMAMVMVLPQTLHKDARGLVAWAVLFLGLGFATAALRAHSVAEPVLTFRYYGPVEGRVIEIDQSSSGRIRLTLDQVRLARRSFQTTPERVRVSVSSDQARPSIGAKVATTANLMPPQGPSEPGGFDFRRYAWFSELGAVGYTRNPVLVLQPAKSALAVQRFRARLSGMIQHRIAGETGGVAAAIIAGDRVGVSQETLRVLRGSNLAHLLAISGLHMGLLSGFVFGFIRVALCLWPALALRCNVKKIAACAALMAAVVYLAISGGNVATERAFIMVSVLLLAVLLDRRALSLRAVAVAATLVLLRRPETLLSPGFQMSFAATTALVAVFGAIRDRQLGLGPAWLRPVLTVVVSSAVAGIATAPYGAAHFNTLAHFGLLANVLAVPIMGLVVVPSAVLALCLAPLGLEQVGFLFLEIGLRWILGVAHWVSSFANAQSGVPSPDVWVLPVLTLGGLTIVLWRGQLRWVGGVLIVLALVGWSKTSRPGALIAADGGLVGIITSKGRALSRETGRNYTAQAWLTGDGERVSQLQAAQRWPDTTGNPNLRQMRVSGHNLVHVIGKRQAGLFTKCSAQDLVVSNVPLNPAGPCKVLQPSRLRHSGSIWIAPDGTLISAADLAGNRPWSRPNAPRSKPPNRTAQVKSGLN